MEYSMKELVAAAQGSTIGKAALLAEMMETDMTDGMNTLPMVAFRLLF